MFSLAVSNGQWKRNFVSLCPSVPVSKAKRRVYSLKQHNQGIGKERGRKRKRDVEGRVSGTPAAGQQDAKGGHEGRHSSQGIHTRAS